MKTRRISRRFGTAILMALALCMMTVTAFATGDGETTNAFYQTAWSLLPPVVAIALALITKEDMMWLPGIIPMRMSFFHMPLQRELQNGQNVRRWKL